MKRTVIWVMFDGHAKDGRVWCVRAGNRWIRSASIELRGTFVTVYRGIKSAQPKAYLRGSGYVVRRGPLVRCYAS